MFDASQRLLDWIDGELEDPDAAQQLVFYTERLAHVVKLVALLCFVTGSVLTFLLLWVARGVL
jgi:hypothetical protein